MVVYFVVREKVSNIQGSTNGLLCSTAPSEKSKVIRTDLFYLLIFTPTIFISAQMWDKFETGVDMKAFVLQVMQLQEHG